MARYAAVTIDVDSLRHYRQIHGLEATSTDADPIYTIAMPRFFALLEEAALPATLFLIGEDVAPYADSFAAVGPTGSEVASHSYSHDYALSQRSAEVIREDLARADAVLRPMNLGRNIAGFRAPGYNVSPALLGAVAARGYAYDSSLLPSPAYWLARSLAIAGYRLTAKRSKSLVGDLRQFAGGLEPFRLDPSRPFRATDTGALVEFPMACLPWARLPLIGTTWPLVPSALRSKVLQSALSRVDFFVFEMHAIDLLHADDSPELRTLSHRQRDLRIPLSEKLEAFRTLFSILRRRSEVRTLANLVSFRPNPSQP